MGRAQAAALAAVATSALLGSAAFAVVRSSFHHLPDRTTPDPSTWPEFQQPSLRGSESELGQSWQSTCVVAGLAIGLAAAVARGARSAVARHAVAEKQLISGGFAGGLVGSDYHGWGSYEWDPLELSSRFPEHLPWYREAELKHGRVAMLAMLGLVVPDFVRLPIDVLEDSSLDFVNAHNKLIGPGLGEGPMWWLLVFCSIVESIRFKTLGLGYENLTLESAGDLNFGKAFLPKTEEGIAQMKTRELKNGRLAMLAFSGAITQGVAWDVHHFPFVPMQAVAEPQMLSGGFAGGLAGSDHHGWGKYEWDPLELSSRYPEHLPWYRESELKHGRVAMLAMLGLVVPDFVRLPAEVFEDSSLDFVNAHNKLIGPGLGEGPMWWLLVFCSVIESLRFKTLGLGYENLTLENAGDLNFGKAFLPKTEEGIEQMKTRELKNGRLAMLAFSGAITQGVSWNVHHFPFVPMQAVAEPQMLSGGFAGGLAGSDYHGWGKYEWDPLELSSRYPEHLAWYRESELKHGRVAMLAMLGLVVPDFVRLPAEVFEDSSLDFVNAHNKLIGPGLGEGPMWWLLVFCSVIESLRFKTLGLGYENLTLENAGDLNFGKAFLPKTEEGIEQMKTRELKNGRLAMLAFSGAITQGVSWDVHHFPFVPMQAVAEPQMLSSGFAGGLVGSDYHGWGKYEWDPLELSSRYPEHLAWYRESELKHGRVAMLAMLGLVVPDFIRLPAEVFEDSSLDFVNAHNKLIGPGLGEGPMWWLLTFCAIFESLRFKTLGLGYENLTLENAGDLNFGKAFLPKTEEGIAQMKTRELKNGRLAMLAFSGAITQGVSWDVHHFPFVPMQAVAEPQMLSGGFAGGLAGSDHHGFGKYEWDPLELSSRYPEHLAWYRESELKHGRVAMLAMLGLVAPDFIRLPAEVFEDSSLDFVNAHNKLIGPGLGEGPMWWLLVFCSVIESLRFKTLGLGYENLTLENAGDLSFGKAFLPKTEEGIEQMKTRELKNGRLAMLAFSGAITQGVTWDVHHFPFVPMQAVAEPQMLSGGFAGGLVGSDYHGWGKYEWDPLELSSRYPEHLPWYRESELKHGRVAMLAMLGLVVPDFIRLPAEVFEDSSLDFVNAHNKLIGPGLGEGPMWWLLVFCSVIESLRFKTLGLGYENLTLENAGDLNFGKAFLPKTEEGIAQMKTRELKNGRLAMLAFSGAITQGVSWDVHHFPFVPMQAVAEPQMLSGGFAGGLVGSDYHGWGKYEWDPLELSARYPEHLPWYRESELKHGRVAMLAMLGLVVPDFIRLPSEVFADSSLDFVNAHNKLIGPGLGEGPMWWLLVFCSVVESLRFKTLGLGYENLTLENAGDLNFGKAFLPKTEEGIAQMKTRELKNGRLAMLAFSGAITQGVSWDVHHFPFVPMQAVAEPQMLSGGFAGGLVGSDYHGWGKYEWDPLELSARYPEHLPWYRESELKHGRVAMLAMLGLVVPDFIRLPSEVFEDSSLDFVNAHNKLIGPGLGEGPMWWLLVFCSVIESLRFKTLGLGYENLTLENAGDLSFGKAFLPKTEEGILQMKTRELKNGRLAMLAFSGAITQGVAWDVHHFPFVPMQAVAEPQMLSGGFAGGLVGSDYHGWGKYEWDPLELSSRYPEHLPWYRESELKHGRVAMLAMLGLVVPDFIRLPAEVFEDSSLDFVNAHNKLIGPGLGEGPMWWLLVFCSVVESLRFKTLGLGYENLTLETAGDLNFGKAFLPKTEEGIAQMKTRELKNGRLAMLAFSGAITQGVTWDVHHFPFVPQ